MELQVEKNILKTDNSICRYHNDLLKRIVNRNFDIKYIKDIIIYLLILYTETHNEYYKKILLQINDEYMKEYSNFVYNNSFWYGHSSYLYILNKMNKFGILKEGNFDNYKNIILSQIQNINNGIFIHNHRWYDLFNGLNGNLIFLLEYDDLVIKKELYKLVDNIIEELKKLSKNQENIFLITEKNYIDKKMKNIFKKNYIDLGVAHGLINILQILYKIYNKYKYEPAKLGMNILIDYYYSIISNFKGKIKNIERISIDKKIRYSVNTNIYKWGNGIHTVIIYLTYYCKLINNKKYDYFKKYIDIEGIKKVIIFNQESKTFTNGIYGYIFNYYFILKKIDNFDEKNKIDLYEIIKRIMNKFEFTDDFSIMEGNLSPIICMPSFNNEIAFEILGI